MITIIAEKPSVARDIAHIVGATEKKDGYITGNGYALTWAFGHLITLAMPNDYGIEGYNKEDLPILPKPFRLKIREIKQGKEYKTDPLAQRQLTIINQLFQQSSQIIVATDAGREGELIFRYIYDYLNCKKPFKRLWISSLTDKAIKEGLSDLKEGYRYDALYQAGKARSEADWLVGINSSRALAIAAYAGGYSLGRVQTPTLAMVCKRYLENKNFTSIPYWEIDLSFTKDAIEYTAVSQKQFSDLDTAKEICSIVEKTNTVTVQKVDKKRGTNNPPLLYDLTTLQKEANKKYGFSADKTLSIAQRLYEKKVATYPRTGSRYISDDIFEQIPNLIAQYEQDKTLGIYAQSLQGKSLNKSSVNTSKVTDHHAILPTENLPDSLSKEEEHIYEMLVIRLLESFSEVAIKEVTTVILSSNEETFTLKGEIIEQLGWKNIQKEEKEIQRLPDFSENETLALTSVRASEHHTKPKALYNEASLLSAMELAGKEIEDKQAKEAMKDCGIGTPATRASIIETLLERGYIERAKKTLIPTEKGLQVYELVKDKKIADAQMTGEWEYTLAQIEQSKILAENFNRAIEKFTSQITEELLQVSIPKPEIEQYECPQCKEISLRIYPKIVKCQNENCEFKLFRLVCQKQLSERDTLTLVKTRKSPLLKGLKSKAGKSFDAYLVLSDDGSTSFEFPEKKGDKYSNKRSK